MKIFILSLFLMASNAMAKDFTLPIADSDKVLKALTAENEIIVNTPKGEAPGLLLKKIDNLAIIAFAKDFARGLSYSDITVTTKTMKKLTKKMIPVDYSNVNEKFGFLVVIDSKDLLGKPQGEFLPKLKSVIVKGTDISPVQIAAPMGTKFLIVGNVKVGTFLGEAGPAGLANEEKYAIDPKCKLGSLLVYSKDSVVGCSKELSGGSIRVGTFDLASEFDQFEVLLNDKKTNDNSGAFYVLYFM